MITEKIKDMKEEYELFLITGDYSSKTIKTNTSVVSSFLNYVDEQEDFTGNIEDYYQDYILYLKSKKN